MTGSLEKISPTRGGESGFAPLSNGPSPQCRETKMLGLLLQYEQKNAKH